MGRRHRRTLPGDRRQLFTGGIWSAYYYNGHVYGSEIARGPDVFELTPTKDLAEAEIAAAAKVRYDVFNASTSRR
ncbi:hypothetical protein OHA25_49050 [Nonomuraea sp. NBC_00507]|uniref:hypothetical protein n=1 Tax=Nonomuraea sp. NBC_00507 TaxID=2976002 RepID=UPI002E1920E7